MEQGGVAVGRSDEGVLRDKKVALTGRLAAMTHREAARLIEDFGGKVVQAPARDTDYLVVGREGLPLGEDGQPTASLLAARQLQSLGYAIQIVSEEVFLSKLHLLEDQQKIRRRYTIVQLTRILGVSRDRIRAWMRAGLIEPVETIHRLAYFDYQQVTSAKMLSDLVRSGLTPAGIRESLARLSRWLPETDYCLSQLSVLESSRQLLVRLADGRLAEPSGQLLMTFEPEPRATVALDAAEQTAEERLEEAVGLEAAGFFAQAADAYRAAARCDPEDAVLQFSLGNVLYSLGEYREASSHFRRAVELEPSYVEAWNNLGNLLAELGQLEEAITALRYALHIVPDYADAHFNLASILATAGRTSEAAEHWQAYLTLDPLSPWADEAQSHLAAAAAVESRA